MKRRSLSPTAREALYDRCRGTEEHPRSPPPPDPSEREELVARREVLSEEFMKLVEGHHQAVISGFGHRVKMAESVLASFVAQHASTIDDALRARSP